MNIAVHSGRDTGATRAIESGMQPKVQENLSQPLFGDVDSPLCPGDILLHGHTHVPAWEPFGENNLYLNPGSVSIPKNGSAHGYMTLEDGVFEWKTLSGGVYHTLTL